MEKYIFHHGTRYGCFNLNVTDGLSVKCIYMQVLLYIITVQSVKILLNLFLTPPPQKQKNNNCDIKHYCFHGDHSVTSPSCAFY